MLSRKFETTDIISVETAQYLYEEYGIASVITDGKYIQLEKEE